MTLATRLSSATALAALALVAGAASASAGVDPALNNPDYYESPGVECTKVEYADGMKSFTVASGATYHVKAGTRITMVTASQYGYTYTSAKDISFIITCTGGGYQQS